MISQRTPEPIDLAELDRLYVVGTAGHRAVEHRPEVEDWLIVVPHPHVPQANLALVSVDSAEDAATMAALHNAYPALRRVVEALQAVVKCDGKYGGDLVDSDFGHGGEVCMGQSDELEAALKSAREALSAFKMNEGRLAGRTPESGSGNEGSNPSPRATTKPEAG